MARPPFPKTLPDFNRQFRTDTDAFNYMVACRWPGGKGFECPKCGHPGGTILATRHVIQCGKCRQQTSATANTVMHRTHTPLLSWLLAAWLVVTDKRGISSVQLANQLGVTQETAYMILHKLRAAMVAPERSMLHGHVEVDESFLGGPDRGRGAEAVEKIPIAGAVEVRDGRLGRARLRHLFPRSKQEFLGFIVENVEAGSVVVTDGLSAYRDLPLLDYNHEVESVADGMAKADVLRHFHLVISNLKTYLAGTYHGAVTPKHVQAYLNEYAFRFNRRNNPAAAFQTLLGIAAQVEGPEYDEIYADEGEDEGWEHPNPRGGR